MKTIWCFNNTSRFFNMKEDYIPLSDTQLEKLVELWNEEKNRFLNSEVNILGDYNSGFITKEEMTTRLLEIQETAFNKVLERFTNEYWINPIKIEKEGEA